MHDSKIDLRPLVGWHYLPNSWVFQAGCFDHSNLLCSIRLRELWAGDLIMDSIVCVQLIHHQILMTKSTYWVVIWMGNQIQQWVLSWVQHERGPTCGIWFFQIRLLHDWPHYQWSSRIQIHFPWCSCRGTLFPWLSVSWICPLFSQFSRYERL